jgi:CheY-like chemotaxis protein
MEENEKIVLVFLSIALIGLSVARWYYMDKTVQHIDLVVIGLVVAAFVIHLIPFDKLTSIKAGGIEVSLEKPEIKAAIQTANSDQIKNDELLSELELLNRELAAIPGSRVMWIDDSPSKIVTARRLLRALGVTVVPATSSEMADEIFKRDKDFDLIITETQRLGDSYKFNNGVKIHEGVNYIVKIRNSNDEVISKLPVIFFSSYDWPLLVEYTRPARETLPEPQISNSINDLIVKVIKEIYSSRSKPIEYKNEKQPSKVEGEA